MPLKKVIADIGRNVFLPLSSKKGNQKSFYQTSNDPPNRHIYYEPPEDFDWDASSSLLPSSTAAAGGEVIVHRVDHQALSSEEFTQAVLARWDEAAATDYQEVMMADEEAADERRSSAGKNAAEFGASPVLERRNKGVLGRLRNLASRTSYSTSEDGHSHSSDYEDQEEEKKGEARFSRDARERTSSSWAGRVRDLHRDVKKKISRLRNSKGNAEEDIGEGIESVDGVIHRGSSVESIPSGSGSSLQPPTPTSSNRSSTSAGEDDHNPYVGTFIGKARAIVDCTPSPYDRDGLAFKKGDIIDIIAKHKTGIWVGMAQGKVGHFKFINVEEVVEERKTKHKHRKVNNEWFNALKKPNTLEELLKQLELEEYTNVLVLNGYDELDTFKEIEKVDLDNLGIVNPEHSSKLLRAVEMLQDNDPDVEDAEDESQIKQSPRDSGCYASHENLIHQDVSHRALMNGQFIVDLEDQDTSQSESGIQSREGQDSALTMNNLDAGAESSKSTMEDMANATNGNDSSNDLNNHSTYNILPSQESSPNITQSNGDTSEIPVTAIEVIIPKSEQEMSSLSVPYFISHSGTKSSPGSPRKTRNKHHRNKSHSHRSREFFNDFSLNFPAYGYGRCQDSLVDSYPDRSGYVYGWASFSKCERSSATRRNVHEYDDVVSDTATEVDDSPGRHVYRKAKQRKGSLQTLIHDVHPPSQTLLSKVNKKLVAEKIYLHEEPYTDKTGFCGIPPALVQRYAEELQHSIVDVADALDQIRITSLQQQGRRGVPNDFLSDSCTVPVIEPNYCNLQSWLTSLGLPMYIPNFESSAITELHHVASLSPDDIAHLGVRDLYHQVYLESAIGALFMRYRRRPQTYPQGQSVS